MSTQDKLAEALRRTCRKMKTFSRTGALDGAVAVWVDEIESALAAHAAEAAQPKTDDFDPRDSFTVHTDTTTLQRNAAPSDAERLAEALRAVLEAMYTAGGRDDDGGRPNSATEQIEHAERIALAALAAHSAQAQPPAVSVPGELAEPVEGVLNYEQERSFAEGWNACRNAMLAAAPQAQDTKE